MTNKKKIVLYGLAGTGTSSVGKLLAEKLNFKFISTGNILREKAKENGFEKIEEYENFLKNKKGQNIDYEIDKYIQEFGSKEEKFVIESRLAWHFILDSFKILLYCENRIRFERISKRENISFEESRDRTNKRQKIMEERYRQIYPKIIYPPKEEIFDLKIDVSKDNIEKITEEILLEIK